MKNFILVGACGYIAPKHFDAIKQTKNNLIAAYDVTQNAGIVDKYFPKCNFFFKLDQFEEFIQRFQRKKKIDYLVICTPNYLHYKFIIFGLKHSINIICEKPLILKTSQLKKISHFQKISKRKVFCIMQLRLNNNVIKFRKIIRKKILQNSNYLFECKIKYITYRGNWFLKSWKGDPNKSGGLTTNIGIHLFDLLSWFFGIYQNIEIKKNSANTNSGVINFKNAKVRWTISISDKYLNIKKNKIRSIRELYFGKNKLELSDNFTNMHVLSYKKILEGKGFSINDVKNSLYITERLRKLCKI